VHDPETCADHPHSEHWCGLIGRLMHLHVILGRLNRQPI
jgi:hypothetical protein